MPHGRGYSLYLWGIWSGGIEKNSKMYSFVNESHMFRYRNESKRKIPVVSGTCITPIHELYHDFVTTIRLIIISIRE